MKNENQSVSFFYTVKVIYQTLLHAALVVMIFLYTTDKFIVLRADTVQAAGQYNGDEFTAFLDRQEHKGRK